MKKERQYPAVLITKKGEISLRGGHPWVYEAEITEERGEPVNGELVDVLSSKGRYLGTGFLTGIPKSVYGLFPTTPTIPLTRPFSAAV